MIIVNKKDYFTEDQLESQLVLEKLTNEPIAIGRIVGKYNTSDLDDCIRRAIQREFYIRHRQIEREAKNIYYVQFSHKHAYENISLAHDIDGDGILYATTYAVKVQGDNVKFFCDHGPIAVSKEFCLRRLGLIDDAEVKCKS